MVQTGCDGAQLSTLDQSERTVAVFGDRLWQQRSTRHTHIRREYDGQEGLRKP